MGTGCCKDSHKSVPGNSGKTSNYLTIPNTFLDQVPCEAEIGISGLTNLGSTCYINAALQCLSNTPPLAEYFLSNLFEDEKAEGAKSDLLRFFATFLRIQWLEGAITIKPQQLVGTIQQHLPSFEPHVQHDCHEFLALFQTIQKCPAHS